MTSPPRSSETEDGGPAESHEAKEVAGWLEERKPAPDRAFRNHLRRGLEGSGPSGEAERLIVLYAVVG